MDSLMISCLISASVFRGLAVWPHAMPRARIRTVSRQPPTSIAGPKSSESDSSLHAAIEQAGDQYEDNQPDEQPSPNVGEVKSPAEAAPLWNKQTPVLAIEVKDAPLPVVGIGIGQIGHNHIEIVTEIRLE